MDLQALSAFALVAAHGGVTQASRASGRPKATLSRQVMELEAHLGVRLFDRGARSIRLTQEGELLHARTTGPLAEIKEAADLLREGRPQPRGRLRVSVPVLFGQLLMGRLAGEFTKAYPEVVLDVSADDRRVDAALEGFDVVVRVDPAPDAALVGRCFARDRLVIVAAPSLAPPWEASDATVREGAVPVVVRTRAPGTTTWRTSTGGEFPVTQVLQLPSFPMVRDAALTGVGAARLPQVLAADDVAAGRLVCWGAAAEAPFELWALHTSRRHTSAKVKVFIRALEAAFPTRWLSADPAS